MKKIFLFLALTTCFFLKSQVNYVAPLPLPVTGTNGGTGVNNGSKTVTLGGSVITTGTATPTLAFPSTSYTYTMPSATSTLSTTDATSINKVTITAPATSATLTVADGKILTASNSLTFTGTDATSYAFPSVSGTVATLTATQTMSNKTLTSPTINSPTCTTPTLGVAQATSISFGGGAIANCVASVTYAPTYTTSSGANTLGSGGSIIGYYYQVGKQVTFTIYMVLGTSPTFGAGYFIWSLPVAMDATGPNNGYIFLAQRFKSIGSVFSQAMSFTESTTTFSLAGSTGRWGTSGTVPNVWAATDLLMITGTYITP